MENIQVYYFGKKYHNKAFNHAGIPNTDENLQFMYNFHEKIKEMRNLLLKTSHWVKDQNETDSNEK